MQTCFLQDGLGSTTGLTDGNVVVPGMRKQVENMNRVGTIVCVLLIASSLSVSCDRSDEPLSPSATPTPSSVYDLIPEAVTLEEARSILPFEVTLPSFLPEGVSHNPELSVTRGRDDELVGFTAKYWEDRSAPPDVPRLRLRIDEDDSHIALSSASPNNLIRVGGEQVFFEASPDGPHSEAQAAWNHEEVAFQVIFAWLDTDGEDLGYVSDQMRADAIKVIESMIQ